MPAQPILPPLTTLAILAFVLSSMLTMGLSLTLPQITRPLRNARKVVIALLVNFALAPAIGYLFVQMIPMAEAPRIALILLASSSGAPFLPKLVQTARGDLAFGVGLMVLLMTTTVVYMPIFLPLLLPGVHVDSPAISRSLALTMLTPLCIGLVVKARAPQIADRLRSATNKVANFALVLIILLQLILRLDTIVNLAASGAIITFVIFIMTMFIAGFVLGGQEARTRSVLAFGSAQRNVSATLIVAEQNFAGQDVTPVLVVGGLLMLVMLLPLAWQIGKRAEAALAIP